MSLDLQLPRELNEALSSNNETLTIKGVEARCDTKDCDFTTTGEAKIDKTDRILDECDLTNKCRKHHLGVGQMTKHNRFVLYSRNRQVGTASVSSQVCTGYI